MDYTWASILKISLAVAGLGVGYIIAKLLDDKGVGSKVDEDEEC